MLQRYQVENYTQTKEYRIKTIRTNNKRFGTDYYSQSKAFKNNFASMQKRARKKWMLYWNDDKKTKIVRYHKHDAVLTGWEHHMMFDSKWEIKIFIICQVDNHIKCEYQPNIHFTYNVGEKELHYHPDFLINGQLYEVKGDQFFRLNEKTNEEEMYCPWRSSSWSDEYYQYRCEKEK